MGTLQEHRWAYSRFAFSLTVCFGLEIYVSIRHNTHVPWRAASSTFAPEICLAVWCSVSGVMGNSDWQHWPSADKVRKAIVIHHYFARPRHWIVESLPVKVYVFVDGAKQPPTTPKHVGSMMLMLLSELRVHAHSQTWRI